MSKNYVCNGAKIKCKLCTKPIGKLLVSSNTTKLQNVHIATEADTKKYNVVFQGNCKKSWMQSSPCQSVIELEEWQHTADLQINGKKALLENSAIKCSYGGATIKIVDHLQKHSPQLLQPVMGPFVSPDEEPAITSLVWKSNKEKEDAPDQKIKEAVAEMKIWLEVTTRGILPGERVHVEVRDKNKQVDRLVTTNLVNLKGKSKMMLQLDKTLGITKTKIIGRAVYEDKAEEAPLDISAELPKLQGDILFVNGYLSSIIENTESHLNAVLDLTPDKLHPLLLRGENVDEKNRINPDDYDTADEQKQREKFEDKLTLKKLLDKINIQKKVLDNFRYSPKDKYWGYWNSRANKEKATETYAKYFNAEGSVHYFNGSHGLDSNGAHRIDHGIALGYAWARDNYDIIWKDIVAQYQEETPLVKQYSTAYKPVTVIGHSQGACMAAGVALGVIKFAADMGYDTIPVNIIFLGVHQPLGLYENDFNAVIKKKVEAHEVNYNFMSFGEEEAHGIKYLNALSDMFHPKHKKLWHKRGLKEHISAISNWEAYSARAVQFTFANDRADLVFRDGDIPKLKSACDPRINSNFYSVEFYMQKPEPSEFDIKNSIDLRKYGGKGGYLKIPEFIANRRFNFEALEELENPTEEQKELGVEWGNYYKVAIIWGKAFYDYKCNKAAYEKLTGSTFRYSNMVFSRIKMSYYRDMKLVSKLFPIAGKTKEQLVKYLSIYEKTALSFEAASKAYAAMQEADLYAHFSPVSLIHHPALLSDFPNDSLGKQSIWQRIQHAAKDRFYRVVYNTDPDKVKNMSELAKRKKEKKYVEDNENKKRCVSTSIGNTEYIQNVISAYVFKDKEAETKLYEEEKHQ